MIGATFDSGAFIALERRDIGMVIKLRVLHQAGVPITIPANAVVEWWRKGHGQRSILDLGAVEPLNRGRRQSCWRSTRQGARGQRQSMPPSWHPPRNGDRVFTSDPTDMQRLKRHYRAVADVVPV